ncbi:MAG: hypothetical protein B6I26_03720 [Desulfobacteraceae bacterium 4572_130]|nr:MAG: hypothetical protein B6I26_03720 [Desulfobacteraceae bacterium 4572_130]
MFQNIMLVGFGGFIGSISRYLVVTWVQDVFKTNSFPFGTLIVNIIGCFVIGIAGGWAQNFQGISSDTRLFLFLGILGGFTTFSAFGYETITLIYNKNLFFAFINVFMHLVFGFGAVLLGFNFSKILG